MWDKGCRYGQLGRKGQVDDDCQVDDCRGVPRGLAGSGQSLLLEGVVPLSNTGMLCLQGVFPEWRDKLERTRIRLQTEVRMEAVDVLFHLNILCNRL